MAVVYETSARVKVYPCAYRGQVEESGVKYLYNPESRLPTENNITTNARVLATVGGGSYMLFPNNVTTAFDLAGSVALEFVIHGYRFEVNTQDIAASFAATTDVYAIIKLKDKNTGYSASNPHDYAATSLDNYNTSGASLDSTSFYGIGFDTAAPEGPFDSKLGPFYLHVLTRTATTDSFHIPSSSLLRLDSRNIANVSSGSATTDSISEHFITDQLEVVNGGDANIADELHVGGATTLSSTLSVTGKTTLGDATTKPGADINGNTKIIGDVTIAAANILGSVTLGGHESGGDGVVNLVLNNNNGRIKPYEDRKGCIGDKFGTTVIAFSDSYVRTTHTDAIQSIEASGISVTGVTTFNNNITLSNNAGIEPSTNGQSWVGSSTKHLGHAYINNMYGKLRGTIALETGLASIDASGYITGLDAGCWYNVVAGGLKQGTVDLGSLCFQIYVAPTNAIYTVYYSNLAILDQLYVRVKSEGTGSTKGKISFEVHNSGWTRLTQSDLQSANIYITKIGS